MAKVIRVTEIQNPRLEEILKSLPKPDRYPTIDELDAMCEKEAAWAEKNYGPDVPRLTPRGRPRKSAKVEKSTVKAVRLKASVWEALRDRAVEQHMTTNAALQHAILDWLAHGK